MTLQPYYPLVVMLPVLDVFRSGYHMILWWAPSNRFTSLLLLS